MRTHRLPRFAAALCAALMCTHTLAQSAPGAFDLVPRGHERPRFTAYLNLPFGGERAERPSYGLRLDSAPLRRASLERIPLIDFQMQPRRSTLLLAGVPALRIRDSTASDSNLDSFLDPNGPWMWIGGAAVALAILCATRHLICERDKDGNYVAPTLPPTTGETTGR